MPVDFERVRLICFDIDGTLSDTDDQFVRRLARLLRPFQPLLPGRDVVAFARRVVMATETPGNLVLQWADRLGIDSLLHSLGDLTYRLGIGSNPEPFLLIPGVRRMLQNLFPHYPLCIVSSRGQRTVQRFLDQFHLSPYFKTIASAQTCRYTKPHPEPILWSASQNNLPASACLMVGDTTIDILAGLAAGAQTTGVLCGFGTRLELEAAGADLILPTTPDLQSLLPVNP